MEIKKMLDIIKYVKSAHLKYDTALTVTKDDNVRDAK
jgi:hypothetical protein